MRYSNLRNEVGKMRDFQATIVTGSILLDLKTYIEKLGMKSSAFASVICIIRNCKYYAEVISVGIKMTKPVQQSKYMGNVLTEDGKIHTEIARRTGISKPFFQKLNKVLTNMKMVLETKITKIGDISTPNVSKCRTIS